MSLDGFGIHRGGRPAVPTEVSQIELENLLLMRNRCEQQQQLFEQSGAAVRDKLTTGAIVEFGVHLAECADFTLRGVRYVVLVVDGQVVLTWANGGTDALRRQLPVVGV